MNMESFTNDAILRGARDRGLQKVTQAIFYIFYKIYNYSAGKVKENNKGGGGLKFVIFDVICERSPCYDNL